MNDSAKLISLLFYTSETISYKTLCKTFGISNIELNKLIENTNKKLAGLGLVIVSNESEAILVTQPSYATLIEEFYQSSPQPLSQAALEVLSIIAYKQPVSKTQIDEIRGVSSDQSIKNLINKQLIKADSKNNETRYRTTTAFLNAMGIVSINNLPKPSDEQ